MGPQDYVQGTESGAPEEQAFPAHSWHPPSTANLIKICEMNNAKMFVDVMTTSWSKILMINNYYRS